jgi:hypothetical protein
MLDNSSDPVIVRISIWGMLRLETTFSMFSVLISLKLIPLRYARLSVSFSFNPLRLNSSISNGY